MSELPVIRDVLRRAAVRRRIDHALQGLWIGLLAGSAVWLLILALYKILPIPPQIADNTWSLAIVGALLGALIRGWRPVPLTTAARLIESRQNLDQRLSTALEVAQASRPNEWTRLVLADAARAVQGLQPSRLLPFHLPTFARVIPVLLAVVVGLGFVPEYRSASHLQAQRDAELVRETGRRMAELVRRELEKRPPESPETRDALEETAALGDRLSQVRLTKADAVKDLANAARRLEDEARQLDSTPALQKLRQAARSPAGARSSDASALQRQMEKLQQSTRGASPDALQKLADQLQQAQKLASAMQGATPDNATQQALAQALSQLSQSASSAGLDLASLNNALDALKNLQIDRVLRDLKLAGDDLEKLQDMAKKLAEMQQNMAQMGKDLAEQLERGQAEAAAKTLDQMVEALKKSDLSPEQKQAMMSELAKATQPAGEYGKVSELLKKAGEKLASQDQADASQNLAQAADELRRMAQQAQEMQQLADALQSLQDAQVALANNKLWQYGGQCKGGNCPGCSQCKGPPKAGQGGRPGRGVGTWADENGWLYYPEQSERWDNTGLERPDQAPKGHTDRGEGALPKDIVPTKLTGQFNPGPMPSITLKGVSIKGQSTVQYQQAVEAAQTEAQSALNQDQVPRAYRGAVKGYFDDLK